MPIGSTRLGTLLSSILLVVACATDSEPEERILVVATTSVLGDIVSNVVGDEGRVEVLIPIGVDSHEFRPSAQQASLIAEADLIVANGLGLEEALRDVLASAIEDGTAMTELAPLVDPLPFSEHEDDDAGHDHGETDPHFWMDPIRVGDAALALARDLAEMFPSPSWVGRAETYGDEMEATDKAIRGLIDGVPEESRKMVTNHQAFGYFADRYGFEIIGVVIPGGSTLSEPSSAELVELVELMEQEEVKVIFAEATQPTTLAEAVAAELGENVKVVELFTESLGSAESDAETLTEMLLTNAKRIAAALD